jgi:outer membrane receptor protein involved in Fe transport
MVLTLGSTHKAPLAHRRNPVNSTHPRRGRSAAPLAAALTLLLSAPAFAQGTAVVTGTVRDASTKAPVPDVVVTVTSPALQGEQTVVTDGAGQYRVPNLPPGVYTLRLEADTYKPSSRGGVELRLGSTIRVNTELLPEALRAEEIVVVASAPTVDVGTSTTGVSVSSDFVSRLPLSPPSGKGSSMRSFESLAEVAPGAASDAYGVSINGTTSPENQYVVDGLSVNNPAFGLIGTPLSVAFIKEVNVITGGYMPEYGRAGGGYFDAVTKSGSNEFHGSVFSSITPGIFEGARKPVAGEGSTISTNVALSSLHDFGFELGGPIRKDRLWFYVGFSPSIARYTLTRRLHTIRFDNEGTPVKKDGFTQTDPIEGTEQTSYATQRSATFIGKLTLLVDPDNTVTLAVFGAPSTSGGDGTFGINPRNGSVEIFNPDHRGVINGTYSSVAHEYLASAVDTSLKWSSAFKNKSLLIDTSLGWHHEESAIRGADGSEVGSGVGLSRIPQVQWQRTTPGPHAITDFEPSAATLAACAPRTVTNSQGQEITLSSEQLCPVSTYFSGGPGLRLGFLNTAILDRIQAKSVLTALFTGLGHHVVKAGIDVELMRYDSARGFSGTNILRESADGTQFNDFRRFGFLTGPDEVVVLQSFSAVSNSTTIGGFVQDSWSILDKVTLNAGLRYDAQLLYGSDSKLAMALPNQISPRVGVIYDFTQSGRSKLFANFARFYESVPLDAIDRSIPGERQAISAHMKGPSCNPITITENPNQCTEPTVVNPSYHPNQQWNVIASSASPVDPDIRPQSSDEIVIGGEYEIFTNGRAGVQYTKRWQNAVIEDMSRDEAQTYFIGNPGYGIAADFPEARRDYDAVTLFFQKSFADTWLAQASYTLSYLRGNWSGLFRPESGQLDPNITSDFDLLSLLDNRDGPLPGDRTHQIKVFGAKDFVFSGRYLLNVGATYRGASGSPTSYFGSHVTYGPDQAFILPRGVGERMPWVHDIDAHVSAGMKLAKESALELSVDAFNIFNFQGEIARDQRYTQASVLPIKDGVAADLPAKLRNADGTPFDPQEKNPNFGKPIQYQPPRSFRIGVKVSF